MLIDLMIINKSGLTIRMAIEDLRVIGRATQGVKLINEGKILLLLLLKL
jgi:DNA gyrase/topoisomerase IV subunit A